MRRRRRNKRVPLTQDSLTGRNARSCCRKSGRLAENTVTLQNTQLVCERVKNITRGKTKHRKRKQFSPYKLAYIAHYGYWHDKKCLSYQCGTPYSKNSLCITPQHLLPESTKNHSERKRCHNLIKKYENPDDKFLVSQPFLEAAKFVDWSIYDFRVLLTKPGMTKMLPDRMNIPGQPVPKTLVLNFNGTLVH